MSQKVFVNRTLNLKKIQYIGFDMDHTLVRYQSQNFEKLVHSMARRKLVEELGYPQSVLKLPFEFERVVRGLVIDRKNGNLLKLNRYSGIRASYHGTRKIDFATQKKFYKSIYIDLGDPKYLAIDTAFSLSVALLFSQLVDLKDTKDGTGLPIYEYIARDIEEVVDEVHRDGTLKAEVATDLSKYIIRDPEVVKGLERYKKHEKKLFILTNSYFNYTRLLLDYAITPYLEHHESWQELFDLVIVGAKKPRFFYDNLGFLKINPADGTMLNHEADDLPNGVYQGGCATTFTKALKIDGEDILYIGDHIYGDILRLKKSVAWRTALVVDELDSEISNLQKGAPLDRQINELMAEKRPFEEEILEILTRNRDDGTPINEDKIHEDQKKIGLIDRKISHFITEHQEVFNKYWGETMRAGAEESYFAYQVERFACIYMSQLKHLLECSPRTYFRAFKRTLPHEVVEGRLL